MYSCPENGQQLRWKSATAKLPAVAAGFTEAEKKSEVGQESAILANDGEAVDQTSGQTLFRPARVLHLFAGKSRGGGLRLAAQEVKQLTKKHSFSRELDLVNDARVKGVKASRRREGILRQVRHGHFDLICACPSFATFARTLHMDSNKAVPLRTKRLLEGIQDLSDDNWARTKAGESPGRICLQDPRGTTHP